MGRLGMGSQRISKVICSGVYMCVPDFKVETLSR